MDQPCQDKSNILHNESLLILNSNINIKLIYTLEATQVSKITLNIEIDPKINVNIKNPFPVTILNTNTAIYPTLDPITITKCLLITQ